MWNQPDKGELEAEREQTFIDDIVQKAHIERELLTHLDGIQTVFDGGAGSGRFSILLAKQGLQVTHFDISQPMIDKAKELASYAGVLDRITFVKGMLEDLSAYADRSFDLVVSFDAPISYTYPNQERTIRELVRIAKKRIMISVSSRLGALPYLANPIQKNKFILDRNSRDEWVQWCLRSREQMIEGFSFRPDSLKAAMETGLLSDPEEARQAYDRGEVPWSITYHFLPEELKRILEDCGVRNVELAGPGAFARTLPNEILVRIMQDPEQRKGFLEFCHQYDSHPSVCGLGKDNLFARGDIGGQEPAEQHSGEKEFSREVQDEGDGVRASAEPVLESDCRAVRAGDAHHHSGEEETDPGQWPGPVGLHRQLCDHRVFRRQHPGRPRQRPEDYPGQQPDRKDLLQRTKIP